MDLPAAAKKRFSPSLEWAAGPPLGALTFRATNNSREKERAGGETVQKFRVTFLRFRPSIPLILIARFIVAGGRFPEGGCSYILRRRARGWTEGRRQSESFHNNAFAAILFVPVAEARSPGELRERFARMMEGASHEGTKSFT